MARIKEKHAPALIDAEAFLQAVMKNLILAKNEFPDSCAVESDVFEVFARLAESLRAGTYSRHVHAIKWACAELKVKNERKVIDAIFETERKKV